MLLFTYMINNSDLMCLAAMTGVHRFSIWSRSRPIRALHRFNRKFNDDPKTSPAFQSAKGLHNGTVHQCQYPQENRFLRDLPHPMIGLTRCNIYKTTFLNTKDAHTLLHPFTVIIFPLFQTRSKVHTSPSRLKVIPFNLADIGEGIREVVIKEWNSEVREGTKIEEFDVICEVESDKASVSITSRYAGIVTKVYHREGDVALVGKPLLDIQIDEKQDDVKKKSSEERDVGKDTDADKKESTQKSSDKTEENSYNISHSLNKESVQKLETESTSSDFQGNRYLEQNAAKKIDQPMLLNRNRWKILATPAVRRMIKQYDINTKHLRGTGKQGRVLKEDIIAYMNSPVKDEETINSYELREAGKPPSMIPIRGYVKGMFKSMTESNKIPTLRLTEEVDTTSLKTARTKLSDIYREKFGIKVTYMPFFIKALSLCIAEYPILNAMIDSTAENILVNPQHNICIAIDTKHGLVVPNIKHVDQLSIGNISRELSRLQASAHAGKVSPVDLQGGTIAISNVGNVGGVLVQPIVMPRHVSILAFGRMVVLPRYDADGSVVPRSVLTTTWAADHRVVDGATVARAAALWKSLVENPLLLLV